MLRLFLEAIYLRADQDLGYLAVECNFCSRVGSVFYEGDDAPAPEEYLQKAIDHLKAEHPETLRAMEARLVR